MLGINWMLVAAVLPSLLLGFYIWRKDPHPEPVGMIIRAALAGMVICVPVAYAEEWISSLLFADGTAHTLLGTTVDAFCVAALPEEAAKLLVLWLLLRRNPHFDEHFDGIVYAVFVSLGFATVENIGYVYSSGDAWLSTAVTRAFLAVPGHYAFAIIMGYYYSVHHFVNRSAGYAVKTLLAPVMVHGIYDALALSGTVDPVVGSIAFFVLLYFCYKMQKEAQRKITAMLNSQSSSFPDALA
jgi:RsiW-degrading membrane proteinase PrsW (M82 family)